MEQEGIQMWINHSRQGDTKSFELLINNYQSMVFRLAFRLLCDEEDAKDIVQETFIKAWFNLNKYNSDYKFATWIYKIACNLIYDRLRSQKYIFRKTASVDIDDITNTVFSENIEKTLINKDLKNIILYFTHKLPSKQKLVFTLRDIEELEVDEVEKITGMSAEKIKSNLHLARKYIREKLEFLI
jgi:RNA polymerase sigma-70 factor (ECF subfamily)